MEYNYNTRSKKTKNTYNTSENKKNKTPDDEPEKNSAYHASNSSIPEKWIQQLVDYFEEKCVISEEQSWNEDQDGQNKDPNAFNNVNEETIDKRSTQSSRRNK